MSGGRRKSNGDPHGHGRVWPKPTLAKPTLASVSVSVVWPSLAKTDFGQIGFDLLCVVCCVWCVCVFVCLFVCVCVAWRFQRFGLVMTALPRTALPRTILPRTALAAGVSHDSPRAQTCTFEGFTKTTKIQREDPQRERQKGAKMGAGAEKKKRNFGRSWGRAVQRRGQNFVLFFPEDIRMVFRQRVPAESGGNAQNRTHNTQ